MIGSEDHLEFYGPSKQICQPSPLPRRHGHKQRDIRGERERERESSIMRTWIYVSEPRRQQ